MMQSIFFKEMIRIDLKLGASWGRTLAGAIEKIPSENRLNGRVLTYLIFVYLDDLPN